MSKVGRWFVTYLVT